MCKSLELETKIKDYFLHNQPEFLAMNETIKNSLSDKRTMYKNQVIDFTMVPFVVDDKKENRFDYITKNMLSIIKKTTSEYLQNEEFRKQFPFSNKMEEMILIDPGYDIPIPIARFDLFLQENDNFKFCELNGDGTSAMHETNSLEDSLLQSKNQLYASLKKYDLFGGWFNELMQIYHDFGGTKSNPNIAIIDFAGLGTSIEFDLFAKEFRRNGCETHIVDPRDLEYKNGTLSYQNFKIDLIYRRAVNQEVEKRLEFCSDLISAYKDKAVCMVGPFRSQIMHNKSFFAILHRRENHYIFSANEIEFIQNHIPKTTILNDETDINNLILQKDKSVLKPFDLYAAKGVYIGKDCSQLKWKKAIESAIEMGSYLVQEFCEPGKITIPFINKNRVELQEMKSTLGLFVYNGKFSGLYHRIGRNNIIASAGESIVRPNFRLKND